MSREQETRNAIARISAEIDRITSEADDALRALRAERDSARRTADLYREERDAATTVAEQLRAERDAAAPQAARMLEELAEVFGVPVAKLKDVCRLTLAAERREAASADAWQTFARDIARHCGSTIRVRADGRPDGWTAGREGHFDACAERDHAQRMIAALGGMCAALANAAGNAGGIGATPEAWIERASDAATAAKAAT